MNLFATYHGGGKGKGSAYSNVAVPYTPVYAYGTLYGTDINYNSGATSSGTTYRIISGSIVSGDLYNVTYVNNADLKVGIAGIYEINWSFNINSSLSNISIKCGISVNSGAIHVSGKIGLSDGSTADYETVSGTVIKNLALNDRISLCFVSLSSNPTVRIGDINLTVHLVRSM